MLKEITWKTVSPIKATDVNRKAWNLFCVAIRVVVPRCSRNSALSLARFAAELLTRIYDKNLPSRAQAFTSCHVSRCRPRVLPADLTASRCSRSWSSERRMTPPVNNSFGEVAQDLLQPHVVFCYLQATEHNSAGGKKAGRGHGGAESWMSVSCRRACGWELSAVANPI